MKLNIEWINDKSIFQFSKTNIKPTDEIFKAGITWNDLSLDFFVVAKCPHYRFRKKD